MVNIMLHVLQTNRFFWQTNEITAAGDMHVFCTCGYQLHTFTPAFTVNQFHTVH